MYNLIKNNYRQEKTRVEEGRAAFNREYRFDNNFWGISLLFTQYTRFVILRLCYQAYGSHMAT